MTRCLDCPCCGEDVLCREKPLWYEDESEKCPDCGCTVSVRIDDDTQDEPVAYTVASEDCQLWAETGR